MSFINWLKKPYFFNPSPKNHLTLAFGVGFFIFIFLYTFQPFGMSELKGGLFFYCLGFGGVTFFIQTLLFVFVPLVFKDLFNDENWTIGKNILFLFILILSISISNWFYNTQVQNTESWRLLTFKESFSYLPGYQAKNTQNSHLHRFKTTKTLSYQHFSYEQIRSA